MTGNSPERHKLSVSMPARHWRLSSRPQERVVGVYAPDYGLQHVSFAIDLPDTRFVRLSGLSGKKFLKHKYWTYSPWLIGGDVDVVHCFNHIPRNRKFVVSHEMELPRTLGAWSDRQIKKSLSRLRSPRCQAILPLSDAAYVFASKRLKVWGYDDLITKMKVFRGCVHVPMERSGNGHMDRRHGKTIRLLFIGGDGLRKGLSAAVDAAYRLYKGGVNVQLTIIGRVTEQSYTRPGHVSGANLQQRIDGAAFISQFETLPHAEVLQKLRMSDVLVFPTVDESLGWVTIEAGLNGIPAIVSSVFAQPELVVHGETGWVLPMELDDDRRWIHLAKPSAMDEWDGLMRGFSDGIVSAVETIAKAPDILHAYGSRARAHLDIYTPSRAAEELDQIYKGLNR